MAMTRRYAVTLPGPIGTHAPPTVILVHLADDLAPGDEPIWTDASGKFRIRIEGEVAKVLAAPAQYAATHPCLQAVPLP